MNRFSIMAVMLLLVGSVCISAPQPVAAQTTDEAYRQTLIQLIQLLQQQIAELQQQLQARPAISTRVLPEGIEGTLLDEIDGDLIASYTVDSMEITGRAPRSYTLYLDRLAELLPDQYEEYIVEFVVFDSPLEIDAYVETVLPYRASWRYGVGEEMVSESPWSEPSTELMVHEFAHIFSLDEVFSGDTNLENCHEYFQDETCWPVDTYLGKYVEAFWSDDMLDELLDVQEVDPASTALYDRYPNWFVSDYAATDPAEDFAESFVWYIYGWDIDSQGVATDKIEFFDRFSFIKEMKAEIEPAL